MKVQCVITTEVNLSAVYALCSPVNKGQCTKAVHAYVKSQIRRMTDPNGGWSYPDAELIASHLIEQGLAMEIN